MNKLCVVRPLTPEDLPLVLEWRNHPDIRRFMFTQHIIEQEEHHKWFISTMGNNMLHTLLVEDDGVALGFVQFNPVTVGGIADWGFYARPNAPKGTGIKLGYAALSYAFERQGLHKVCGQSIDINTASIDLHEKLGFRQEGVLREQHRMGNKYHSLVCFGMLADEWSKVRSVE